MTEDAAVWVETKSLLPWPKNPRDNDGAVERVAKSIEQFGFGAPIIARLEDKRIIAGHTRLKAALSLGLDRVPVRYMSLGEADASALALADNKLSEIADWDDALLRDVVKELSAFDDIKFEDLGFDLDEIQKMLEDDLGDEDAEEILPETPEDPTTQRGDLWVMGRHRILCGDATSEADIAKLMGKRKADMVFTDPPYGMGLDVTMSQKNAGRKDRWIHKAPNYEPVIGDNEDFTPELITTVFKHFGYCKEIFLWGADYYAEHLDGKNGGSWIVWDKRASIEDVQWSTSEFELCWSKAKHHRKIARILWSGLLGMEQEHDHRDGRQHPTQKPTRLVEWAFHHWGKEGDTVADIYLGSGSTLIACEKTARVCTGMEISPAYCDVVVKRWENLTGEKATRIAKED